MSGTGEEAWAVGWKASGSGLAGCPEGPPSIGIPSALIERWNGSAWRQDPTFSPPVAAQGSELVAVVALAADDVWAGGHILGGMPFIVRWDGNQWQRMPTPPLPKTKIPGALLGLDASSDTDVWVVGQANGRGFADRWDGHRWSQLDVPRSPDISAISVVTLDNVWVAGGTGRAFAEHWNGTDWNVDDLGVGQVKDIAATRQGDVWAVGSQNEYPLLLQRVDGHWVAVKSDVVQGPGLLSAVAVEHGRILAVGEAGGAAAPPLILSGGTSWTKEDSPAEAVSGQLFGIGSSAGRAWVVGTYNIQGARRTQLILRSNTT